MQVCPSLGLQPPGLQLSDETQLWGARGRGWQGGTASLLPALRVGGRHALRCSARQEEATRVQEQRAEAPGPLAQFCLSQGLPTSASVQVPPSPFTKYQFRGCFHSPASQS